jgi:hypothetical protein
MHESSPPSIPMLGCLLGASADGQTPDLLGSVLLAGNGSHSLRHTVIDC